MRIYLDSRDLILLAEHQSDAYLAEVGEWLHHQAHELALSLSPILECCVPLTKSDSEATVMRTLTRIEKLPHTFIAEAKIPRDELISAVTAYSEKTEYAPIDPYVSRFDEVLSPFYPPATKVYLTYGLAETIFELFRVNPDLFAQDVCHSEILARSRELDRSRPDYKRHGPNFLEYVRRTLAQFNIGFPQADVEGLASWIWTNQTVARP